MPMPAVFQALEDSLFGVTGSGVLVAILVYIVVALALMFAGLDFRFAFMISSPVLIGFASMGWFPLWVSGLSYVIVVGFGIYIVWNTIRD